MIQSVKKIGLVSMMFCCPRSGGETKVAVYDNGPESHKLGVNYIYDALKTEPGIKVETIDNLALDTLKKYDAVVISTVTKLAAKDIRDADRGVKGTDWIRTLTNYVDCGGGLVLGHNAVGFRGIWSTYKLFPMVGTSQKRNLEFGFDVTDATHPVMANMPAKFAHQYDHMELIAGKAGKTLATDKLGNAMVVASEVSRGRIVQIGFPMGLYWKDKTGPLPETDKRLLLNSVKWAGAQPKYDVPMKATESGLLAETRKFDSQLSDAELTKYRNLPAPKFDEAMIWLPSYWLIFGAKPVGLSSPEIISTVMDNCKRMGFTKVGITAKAGVYFYPTAMNTVEEKRECRNGFSPVGCMVDEARKRGMKVSLIIFPFKSSLEWDKYAPNINDSEYSKLQSGEIKIGDIDADSKWSRSNCPDHPAVRAKAMKITEELIAKYHPDELYLDYIRYKDGYDTSCYCDYSMKQKVEFAAKHPEIPQNKVNEKFSEESLVSFVGEWVKLCKALDPNIKTACYTISAPGCKAPDWVNRYPLDFHGKYVSRHTSGPESSLEDTANLTKSYSKWAQAASPNCRLSPIIAVYDPKSPERIFTEFKIVSDIQNKGNEKWKRVEFYDYPFLIKDKKLLTLDQDMVNGISKALVGSANK
ncbi:MAG: ThuA domain-containing protein [Victivallaceae bacterium]